MTNIKTSRKGMRLNDARYFRLPLPHTRKKMMIMRVIPRITDPESCFHMIHDSTILNPELRIGTKSRDRSKTVESNQSSIEIALLECRGYKDINQNEKKHQDICVETESIELSSDLPSLTRQEDVLATVEDNSKELTEFLQAEDDPQETVQEIVFNEKLHDQVERSCKSVEWKRNCGDRVIEVEERKKCSSWWKNSGQTILQFFAKILGKRGEMGAKGPTDRVLPTGKQAGRRVKRVSRGGKSRNGHRRGVDGNIRLKRVNNGYIANHAYRAEGSRHGIVTENKSREEQQQHHPSILVRQIQRTRDKNLRVMLLERELRIRQPKIARKNAHLTAINSVNIRKLSSPLC